MPATLYTIGYQQRSLEEYIAILREAEIDVVIDVRDTAWSHKPGFSKSAFKRALAVAGIEYIHAKFAGNPKWLRSEAPRHHVCLEWYAWYVDEHIEIIETFDQLIADLIAAGKRTCITCFERHAEDCHRSILADRWRRRGRRRVAHLAIDGCERLISV